MDFRIIWSERSLNNLREIVQFIAGDNRFAAEQMGNTIIKKVSFLSQFPELGRVFAKLKRNDIREIAVPPYRVIYQILKTEKAISIVTVWHGARQEPDL